MTLPPGWPWARLTGRIVGSDGRPHPNPALILTPDPVTGTDPRGRHMPGVITLIGSGEVITARATEVPIGDDGTVDTLILATGTVDASPAGWGWNLALFLDSGRRGQGDGIYASFKAPQGTTVDLAAVVPAGSTRPYVTYNIASPGPGTGVDFGAAYVDPSAPTVLIVP